MVGEAAADDRRPRLVEVNWGSAEHPKLTLVGKGVCFDTGGLDIKPSGPMRFMKKDMGGAAHVLGLAMMIMAAAKMHNDLRKHSSSVRDPVWPMPLHQFYRKHIKSDVGDVVNSAGMPGDLIYSALFLETFVGAKYSKNIPNWIHLDCNAWENVGRTGRPKGGADTGLRGMFEFVKKRYS